MRLLYTVLNPEATSFPLGRISSSGLRIGARFISTNGIGQFSELEVLDLLRETIMNTSGKIKIVFDDVLLEIE